MNIQTEVTNFIDQDVSMRRGLSRGYINTRSLAKYIHDNLNISTSLDAIISAIRRYQTKEESKEDIKTRYKYIASAKVSSRTRMASVLFRKEMDVRKSLINLYNKIDFSKGDVLRILEVGQFLKIIIDEDNLKLLEGIFDEHDIISYDKKLGEVSLIYDRDVIETPGIFAALGSELAQNNISIRDGVICGSEHVFILKEDDVMKALQVLYKITKWGEKN